MGNAAAAGTMEDRQSDGTAAMNGRRVAVLALALAFGFLAIGGQLARHALSSAGSIRLSLAEPIARAQARPDIVDRHGRIIATDVVAQSLYADPALILDPDEAAERIAATLKGIDVADLRRMLSERHRRFIWIRRGLAPVDAQRVHDLGIPGLALRREPKRAYPTGALTGHIVGHVGVDNRGLAGVERHIDEAMGRDLVSGAARSHLGEVRLSIDLGVQHAVADELSDGMRRYSAKAALGMVMDVVSGELLAAVTRPGADPSQPQELLDPGRADRAQGGVYELGSIMKIVTVAMGLDAGLATSDRMLDVHQPLTIGRHTLRDLHPSDRPMSVRDVLIRSSNVGAALIALDAGVERQLAFLSRLGLSGPMRTEAGPVATPLLPARIDRIESATIGYGHGIALAPLQFATAAATLLNGGWRVVPTYLLAQGRAAPGEQVISAATSAELRSLLRQAVIEAQGTGRRADVAGYEIGGKTGTAEMPGRGGYRTRSVIASFLGVFPVSEPRYLTLVTLFEPQPGDDTRGGITAGLNAAPVTARIIERIAPLLDVVPAGVPEDAHTAGGDRVSTETR